MKIKTHLCRLAYWFLKKVITSFFRINIEGKENIPERGPAIIVANHSSYLDIAIIGLIFYYKLTDLSWVMSKENYRHWFLKWFYLLSNVIVVNGTIEKAERELRLGRWVVIFPEGAGRWLCIGQSEKRKPGKGAAILALSTGIPIIPIGIQGSDKAWPPHSFKLDPIENITARVGEPLRFDIYNGSTIPQDLLENSLNAIMVSVRRLAGTL